MKPGSAPASTHLVSSFEGSISRLLLALPRYAFQNATYFDLYRDLLSKLPDTAHLLLVVHASAQPLLEVLLAELDLMDRSTIVPAPEELKFSVWVSDTSLVAEEANGSPPCLVEPVTLVRGEDRGLASLIARESDLGLRRVPLYFEGGNVLVGDRFWLVGGDHARISIRLGLAQPDIPAAVRAFEDHLDGQRRLHVVESRLSVPIEQNRRFWNDGEEWTESVFLGNKPRTRQPLYHIDMFLTLAGRDFSGRPIVVVGDPRAASRILNQSPPDHAMIEIFDDVAAGLEELRFQVVRNPLPLIFEDHPSERRRKWFFASYNNALVEIAGARKKIWLPTFGDAARPHLEPVDEANIELWRSLGFDVTPIANAGPLAYNLGGVHCLAKCVARSVAPQS